MSNSDEQQSVAGVRNDGLDPTDQISDGGEAADVFPDGCAATSEAVSPSITERLTEIFVADGDGDLLQRSSEWEIDFLQWLRALDMQVIGACRADERLNPLLKLNVSAGVAEDGLLAHLSQHFELAEVGLLARCLFLPLVSIRVGKIDKQGVLLYPTSVRGNLYLTLLPTSDMRLSFNGDDGSVERLATLSSEALSGDIAMEDIPADTSGRSFLIKTPDTVLYFWCSEKSMLLGDVLLAKMKDLLVTKPSLAELTGISESRLSYFANHLRAYLTDTAVLNTTQTSGLLSSANPADDLAKSPDMCPIQSSNFLKNSSFKEGLEKSSSSLRSAAASRGENYMACVGSQSLASSIGMVQTGHTCFTKDKVAEVSGIPHSFPALNFLDVSVPGLEIQVASSSGGLSPLSPQYCWCPPVASAMQYTIGSPQLPIVPAAEQFSLPPLSTLMSSNLMLSKPVVNIAELPPLLEPIVRLPISQQIPMMLTPLVCDPIVHVPMFDVCSSGGYLATSLPTVESAVEKGARETLRMLINGSSSSSSNQASNADQKNMSAATVGMVFFSDKSFLVRDDLAMDHKENQSGSGSGSGSGLDEGLG